MYKGVLLFQKTILLYFLYYRVWGTLYSQIFSRGTSNERIAKLVSAQKAVAIILPRQFLYLKTLRHKALLKTHSCKLAFLSQYVELNFMEVPRVVYREL